jgi:hypothetical protein
LSPGDYTLSARWPASSTPVTVRTTLANREDRRGIDIVLPRGLEIAGIVRGADGRPLSQVQVRLTGEAQSNEAHLWFYAMTDASGRFGSQGMPPGTFRLACFPEQENVDANGSSRASPKVMSGIEAGRHDVDVQVAPGSWMRCVVLDASGMSAPSAQVIVYDGDAELVRLRTDGNGHCGMILDRTHTWNLVATPSIIRSRALDPTAAPEAAYSTRADGIAPGGPEIELRLPAQ